VSNIFKAPYTVTQPYGCTGFPAEPPYGNCEHFHRGIDLVGPNPGCPVYAASPGTARFVGNDPSGNYVIIECDDGHWEAYWHDQTMTVRPGQHVDNSVEIATEGSPGNSTGAHVHFECEAPGPWSHLLGMTPINPTPYLQDAQGGADDMNPRQLVESLYDLLVGSRPSEEVLAAKAQYVADNGPQQVVKDLIDAGSRYMSQRRALSTYQQARVDAGSRYPDGSIYNPDTFAEDRLNGGGNFQSVIEGDVAYYIAQDQHLQDLLSKDVPAPLSPDDQEDLAFGKTVRSYMKGLK